MKRKKKKKRNPDFYDNPKKWRSETVEAQNGRRLKVIENQKAETLSKINFSKIVRMRETESGIKELKRLGYKFPNIKIA